ncbi:MAG: DUF4097 domain-containing protein [Bacteroidetes bacterium]|nr:DUF4097 domain-containing protein [Bacteroidota bacterium]
MKMKTTNFSRTFLISALLVFFGISAIGFQGCTLFKKRYEKTEVKEYSISAKNFKKFSIDNPNGNVYIRKNSTDSLVHIRAEITKYVSKKELNEPLKGVLVDIDSTGDELRVRDIVNKETHEFISFSFRRGSSVNYEISLPEGMDLKLSSTNGKIRLEDLNNDVNADLTNGNIKLDNVYGKLTLELTNGSISAKIDSTKGINFETTNGSITLAIGDKFSGNFKTETVNGKVHKKNVNFNESDESKREFKGKLGNTDIEVKLQTVNGSINIERK